MMQMLKNSNLQLDLKTPMNAFRDSLSLESKANQELNILSRANKTIPSFSLCQTRRFCRWFNNTSFWSKYSWISERVLRQLVWNLASKNILENDKDTWHLYSLKVSNFPHFYSWKCFCCHYGILKRKIFWRVVKNFLD